MECTSTFPILLIFQLSTKLRVNLSITRVAQWLGSILLVVARLSLLLLRYKIQLKMYIGFH